jgi:hypothetical protein
MTSPEERLVTTHSETDGQETAPLPTPMPATCSHALAPPVGSVDVKIPLSPTVTHNDPAGDEHDTPKRAFG